MQPTQLPLRDIHLPEAIGWWPPASGWWLVAILLPLLIFLSVWFYKRITRKTALKEAKKLFLQLKKDKHNDNNQKLEDLSALFRRTAISIADRKDCAGLTGQQWLEYLESTVKGTPFTQGAGQLLVNTPYQQHSPSDDDIVVLTRLYEYWLNAQIKAKR